MKDRHEAGSILIVSLWSIMVLSFFALTLAGAVQQEIQIFDRIGRRDEARRAQEAGIFAAIDQLRLREPRRPFTIEESLTGAGTLANGVLGSTAFWVGDRNRLSIDMQNHMHSTTDNQNQAQLNLDEQNQTHYGIIDEARKLNLNRADRFMVKRLLLRSAGLKEAEAEWVASAVIDYRDSDDYVNAKADNRGSERAIYHRAGLDYGPKNDLYEMPAEVLRVPGMTEAIYVRIRKFLTVYGDGSINLNTASEEVLVALDLHPDLIGKILSVRVGPDGQEASGDEMVFVNPAHIENQLGAKYDLSEAERISLRHVISRRLVGVGARDFTVLAFSSSGGDPGKSWCVFRENTIAGWYES